jgi:hypothetical protein
MQPFAICFQNFENMNLNFHHDYFQANSRYQFDFEIKGLQAPPLGLKHKLEASLTAATLTKIFLNATGDALDNTQPCYRFAPSL